ncbi:hypothetical protein [Phaeacidiphilus oryzae]|uniref:hypothetical protein n=1 Tax=Phaeacidiphilus oryzae TaxID=348818 RepID=UPI00056351E2|nr:hypothetical protein [Phaeacidiphilus oryzae]
MSGGDVMVDRALVEESAKKSALVWVRVGADDGAGGVDQALWHVWHDGAVAVVGGGQEQPLPAGLVDGAEAVVTVRSKDKWGRLVAWPARVVELAPGSERWAETAEELKGKRLNAPDFAGVLERWAASSRVLRLEPAGGISAGPGAQPAGSLAARAVATGATTRERVPAALPRLLFRRGRGRGRDAS